ncbi:hypothetical protein HDU86_008491 [Geranomyces michiganensis]|nr:hypothetical protein HDU86_008491 [Geranomyces michiganensis]
MGGKVARSYTLTICCSAKDARPEMYHVQKPGVYSEEAWRATDSAIAIAAQEGVRLIIPFIDWWSYHGGVTEFAAFYGKTQWEFFTDPVVRRGFKDLITYALTRKNSFNGIAYKDDPTVMLWETGNEMADWNGFIPPDWTLDIAAHIKSVAPNQLVGDSSINHVTMLGPVNPTTHEPWGYNHTWKFDAMRNAGIMASPNIDVFSDHYYNAMGTNDWSGRAVNGSDIFAIRARKAYYIGEFGFAGQVTYTNLLNVVLTNKGISGALIWSLRGHSRWGGFYRHNELDSWFSYHLPGFAAQNGAFDLASNADEILTMNMIRTAAAQINGISNMIPFPIPDAPYMRNITKARPQLSWIGSAGATSYEVWRAEAQVGAEGKWVRIATGVSDAKIPGASLYTDATTSACTWYYYMARGVSESGPGFFSNAVPWWSGGCTRKLDL